jgi:hypothetical protein
MIRALGWTSKPLRTVEVPEPSGDPLFGDPSEEPERPLPDEVTSPERVPAGRT